MAKFPNPFATRASAPAPAASPVASSAVPRAASAAPGIGDLVKDTTTQGFVKDVIEASKTVPVLIDFWAPWCGPCKTLSPVIEKLVRAAKGKVKLVKMNIDDHPAVAGQMGVQSIPAVFAFVNGRPVDGFMGALPESQVKAFIDRLLAKNGAPDDELGSAIESAQAAFDEGDLQGAAEIYAALIEEDKDNLAAIAGLANCQTAAGEFDQAERTLALVPAAKQSQSVIAGARATLDLARKVPAGASVASLQAKLGADPNDHQARYDLALALNASGDKAGAVNELLDIMRRDRQWNEDGARKQLVQLFEAWGPKDETTLAGRKRLSVMLFS